VHRTTLLLRDEDTMEFACSIPKIHVDRLVHELLR
jgi:hypothetical protein